MLRLSGFAKQTNSSQFSGIDPLVRLATAGLMLMYFIPFVLLGADSYITIHDNLDSDFVYKRLLVNTGQALNYKNDSTIQNVMNGIPRSAYRSGFDFTLLLFYLFDSHVAYIVNYIIIHLVAFLGMFLLLKEHFMQSQQSNYLAWSVAVCFALIPFYGIYGLSVAGQPILLRAFLNILYSKQKLSDYIVILLFPFYSSLPLVAPFIISFLVLIGVFHLADTGRVNKLFFVVIAGFGLTYALTEWQMIYSFVNKSFVSHRTVWDRWNDFNLLSNMSRAKEVLLNAQYHAGIVPAAVILLSALVASIVLAVRKTLNKQFVFVIASIMGVCMIYGFHDWIVYYCREKLPQLKFFNVSRFTFLLPILFMLLFAIALFEINKVKRLVPLAWGLLAVQLGVCLNANLELKNNLKLLAGRNIEEPTYHQFFSPELFLEVEKYIGRPKEAYRVVSIGMHPSVAQFNGFYTLDSYQQTYELEYKKKFREIFELELGKNSGLREYFDGWGNRCYVFVSELGKNYLYGKSSGKVVKQLELNTSKLRALGGEYILSAVEIGNYQENGLDFEGKFSDGMSYWDVYLYKVP